MVRHVPVRENHKIDYISGNSQRRINILVSTHIFPGVRSPIKALFSVLDHYNMLQHAKYTFQMVHHIDHEPRVKYMVIGTIMRH